MVSVSVLATEGLLRLVVFAGCTEREYSSGCAEREYSSGCAEREYSSGCAERAYCDFTSAVDAELVAVTGYGGAFMLPARDRAVVRGVGGKTAICRCCCADNMSTAVVPASRDAAIKVLRWCEIGSGEVGPYKNVVIMADCRVIICDCSPACETTTKSQYETAHSGLL